MKTYINTLVSSHQLAVNKSATKHTKVPVLSVQASVNTHASVSNGVAVPGPTMPCALPSVAKEESSDSIIN